MISNNHIPRTLLPYVLDAVSSSSNILFLTGPRGAGKTTLLKSCLKSVSCAESYFDFGHLTIRRRLERDRSFFGPEAAQSIPTTEPRWAVIEGMEKITGWQGILGRTHTLYKEIYRFIFTANYRLDSGLGPRAPGGSVRLELMPLTLREILGWSSVPSLSFYSDIYKQLKDISNDYLSNNLVAFTDMVRSLLLYGPFPEPLLRQSERFSKRWHVSYIQRLLHEEVKESIQVSGLDRMERLIFVLARWVGSPLSMPSVGREVAVAHPTIKAWLEVLEKFYLIFAVPPWYRGVTRGLRKALKWYFLDWRFAGEQAGLENVVASCLYRWCSLSNDMCLGNYRLHYLRTLDKKGLRFVVMNEGRPILAVDLSEDHHMISRAMRQRKAWFGGRDFPGIQVVETLGFEKKVSQSAWILGIDRFLALLG